MASSTRQARNGRDRGFEATLWRAADKLRGNLDASDYKHVVLGLFLKDISDAFESKHGELVAQRAKNANPEETDEYRVQSIFWVSCYSRSYSLP